MDTNEPRLHALDGLRGLAALAVLVGHHNANPAWTGFPYLSYVQSRISASPAVCVFFTLSAFLLTYLLVRERDQTGTVSIRRFFARRIFRIWPLYFVVLVFGIWSTYRLFVPQHALRFDWIIEHLWMYVGFLSNWSLALSGALGWVDYAHSPQNVLWSIAVEEQFYLFCPFAVLLMLRSSWRAQLLIVLALVVAAFAYRGLALMTLWPIQTSMPRGIIYYATPSYIDVFAVGGTAGWLTARRCAPKIPGVVALAGLIIGAIVWRNMLVDAFQWAYVVAQPVVAIGFSLVMLWLVQNSDHPIPRILGSRPFAALGALSYGMYLWHPVALDFYGYPLAAKTAGLSLDMRETISFAAFIGVPITFATISYFVVEIPYQKLRRNLHGRPAQTSAPIPVAQPS